MDVCILLWVNGCLTATSRTASDHGELVGMTFGIGCLGFDIFRHKAKSNPLESIEYYIPLVINKPHSNYMILVVKYDKLI